MRMGVGVYVVAQALIMMGTLWGLFSSFQLAYPAMFAGSATLSFATFKRLKPWNLRQSKQKTCECQCCSIFGCYEKGLATAMKLLEEELGVLDDADESDEDTSDEDTDDESSQQEVRRTNPLLSHPGMYKNCRTQLMIVALFDDCCLLHDCCIIY